VCPEVFELRDDGYLYVLQEEPGEALRGAVTEAEELCPTGAITYALPTADALARRMRAMLATFAEAGGRDPILLIHDEAHGEALIDALSRHGDGLPARVLPLRVNEVSQLDLSLLAGAFAWGAAGVRLLLPARRPHGSEGVFRNLDYLGAALPGLGIAGPRAMAADNSRA